MTPEQAADYERMRHAIYNLGVIPFYDGNNFTKTHRRGSDGKCSKDRCHEPWPCKAALRQLNAHGVPDR